MKLLPVKPFQETLGKSACAPATLKMLLTYWKLPGREKTDMQLARVLGTDPKLGTTNRVFLKTIERFGLTATVKTNGTYDDIQKWLKQGVPVVVDWFTPGPKEYLNDMPDGHYSIVVGFDRKHIYLQDPEIGRLRKIVREHFWRVWFDFEKDWITHKDDMVLRWMAAVYPIEKKGGKKRRR